MFLFCLVFAICLCARLIIFFSRHSWKKIIRCKLSEACVSNVGLANADEAACRFQTIHPESKPCYFCDLSRKHQYMLTACKSVVQMIAMTFSNVVLL